MLKKLSFGLILTLVTVTNYAVKPSYIDNQTCLGCHKEQAKQWQSSDHYYSMLPANEKTVLGNFNEQIFTTKQQKVRFFKKNNQFYIAVTPKGKKETVYEVKYTFGYHPLQQYLLVFPNGKLQVFNIAWDTINHRWFKVVDKAYLSENSPFHWTKRFYNWNYACAECHSTNYQKNVTDKGYQSQFSGVNVNCQACHGPGSEHVKWAKKPIKGDNGLIVQFSQMSNKDKVELCAHCHSRRSQVTTVHDINQPFHHMYIPALLRPNLYWADGQIKDEVFVYGSFIQSKMYQAGVQCMDCHQPHSLKLKLPGNQICTQCHNANPIKRYPQLKHKNRDYDAYEHTHHKTNTSGSQCVNCHMPATNYMKIDPRRDHSFKVPNPALTIQYGIPNACNRCHQQKSAQWALDYIKQWYGQVYQNSPLLIGSDDDLLKIYKDKNNPDIFRASAIMLMQVRTQQHLSAILSGLEEPSPLIQKASLDQLSQFNPNALEAYLKPKLENSNPIIRGTVAKMLTGSMPMTAGLDKGQKAYVAMQQANIDQPESRINLAQLYFKQGKKDKAIKSLKQSLTLDKHFIPAYQMLAQMYALQKDNAQVVNILNQGIKSNPDSAQLYFMLGLAYAEIKDYIKAQNALEKTLLLNPNYPRASQNLMIIKQQLNNADTPSYP